MDTELERRIWMSRPSSPTSCLNLSASTFSPRSAMPTSTISKITQLHALAELCLPAP